MSTTTVRQQLIDVALAKGLRQATLISYETMLGRVLDLDLAVAQVEQEAVLERLWLLDSPNTRRSTVIALRSVLGWQMKVPKGIARRYDLPDEDTLRLALMLSRHETRGLLMGWAGLRIGEACATTAADLVGEDRLRVAAQISQLHRTGHPTVVRRGPVKISEAEIVIPRWLVPRVQGLDCTVKPDAVREGLRRAGAKVGIVLNPHQLRHFYATNLLAKGVPLTVVQRQMRHTNVASTLRYQQANDGESIHDALG